MLQPYTNKGLFYMEIITKTIHKLTHNSDSNIGNKISACSFIPTRHRINISIRTKLNMHVSGTMSNNHYLVLEPQDLEEKKTQKAHYNFTIGAIPFDGKARYAHGKKQDFDFMLENCEPNTSEETSIIYPTNFSCSSKVPSD